MEASNGEPPHYICTQCYQQGKRSIMQARGGKPRKEGGMIHSSFYCSSCAAEAFADHLGGLSAKYAEDIKQPE
jgi:hypothetical protein